MSPSFLQDFSRPLLFAHRGYSAKAPENTIAAFKLAWESGIPGVELDVHLCKSGEMVVFHDDDLERITGTAGTVESTDLETLKSLDAGNGERIPLLSEVFEAAPEHAYFDIEMKVAYRNGRELSLEAAKLIKEQLLPFFLLLSILPGWL